MNYPRPEQDSGLGIHLGSNAWFPLGENENQWGPICDDILAMGVRWVKVLSAGNDLRSAERCIDTIVGKGLMPIVRFMWDKTYPVEITDDLLRNIADATRWFVGHGVHYFETDNEPNLIDEWRSEADWHKYDAPDARPHHAADVWARKANAVFLAGGIPLLVALAPGGHHDDEDFYPRMVQRLKDRGEARLLKLSAIACHNYWLNHPVDFPYDPVNQAEHGPVTVHSGRGMSNGFLKYKYVYEVFERIFGFDIPVLTTEGGPRIGDHQDARYPKITLDVHQDYILQQARHMATEAPSWYFCTNDWLLASKEFGGSLDWEEHAWRSPVRDPHNAPIIATLKQRGFVERRDEPDPTPPAIWGDKYISPWRGLCEKYGAQYNLDPQVVATVMKLESNGDPNSISTAGAVGLMQVMPAEKIPGRPTTEQLKDPDFNVKTGCSILRSYMDAWQGSLAYGLASYYMGVGGLQNQGIHSKHAQTYLLAFDGAWRKLWKTAPPPDVPENIGDEPPPTPEPPSPWPADETVRDYAWAALYPSGVPRNPDSAFYKAAREKGLGVPVTEEVYEGDYVLQGYVGGILICRKGDWGNMRVVAWL